MKLKFLLFVLLTSIGIAQAEDTIRSLIISEACLRNRNYAYLQLTNMGEKDVQLGNFKIANIEPWGPPPFEPRYPEMVYQLPERILAPGESFLIATVSDFNPKQHAKGIPDYSERLTKEEMLELADIQFHIDEGGGINDSVTHPQRVFREIWWGRNCFMLEQHFENGDSVVVDQVNGVFDGDNGLNKPFDSRYDGPIGYDVAGVAQASYTAYLIRKFSVKTGNLDFRNARGVGLEDSEWIAIPIQGDLWRKALWTVGNHVNAKLDENTLESDVIEVDFAGKTLTVPWGIRRNDDIMNFFVKKPGIGWNFHRAPNTSIDDSLSFAAKTGDKLELFVVGEGLDRAIFEIIVKDPTADSKLAVPKLNGDAQGNWRGNLENGILTWPRITRNESGNDTIWGEYGGIPYQTRIDSLVKLMEIPSNATWELVTIDGLRRPDIEEGDIFRIIAEDGSEKDYYISVNEYNPSHNARLSAITWPDIPEFYRGIFGWKEDTIPNFGSNTFNYKISVPSDLDRVPGLIAKTADLNARVEVKRASNLDGTPEDRTITFIVTAEDDTTVVTYNVEIIKEKKSDDIQPFNPDPFISEFVFKVQWDDSYLEIFNPGNQAIDLSNYAFVGNFGDDPLQAIINATSPENFNSRYKIYIPGYKYTNSEANWQVYPGILEPDLNVSPIVLPNDVFVMADIKTSRENVSRDLINIDFKKNPWDAEIGNEQNVVDHWEGGRIWMFRILNDSITRGLKAPNDINDLELIDAFSNEFAKSNRSYRRKAEIWKGNPVLEASQEDDGEGGWLEWEIKDRDDFPNRNRNLVPSDIGHHNFIPPTHYISTVNSLVYKVSEGYSLNEQIRGVITGTTVSNLLANLIKANEGQSLTATSVDGTKLDMDALLSLNDTLTVLSADSLHTTKYVLEVSEDGLSSDAVLTSDVYDIELDAEPKSLSNEPTAGSGIISGFDYGTKLNTIIDNITVPEGASMSIINAYGAYVPLKRLNFDTIYVDVTANSEIYFEVLAEDMLTRIIYQLQPEVFASDAFVTSELYSVKQEDLLIELVPRGTNVQSFLSNLIPASGASLKIIDKWGNIRTDGIVADDDKLVVTSADETVTNVYHISKLASQYVPVTTYLAYVLSDVYGIDQVDYSIAGATTTTQVSDFYSNIRPVMGATAVIVDTDGNEKTAGDLAHGDKVKVTSGDGKIEVMYALHLTVVSAKLPQTAQIEIYPNPTSGKLNVSGLQPGSRIQIFNATGVLMQAINVKESKETVSLESYSKGIYFVIISDNHLITAKHKIIKF
jgi:hypothetical protein